MLLRLKTLFFLKIERGKGHFVSFESEAADLSFASPSNERVTAVLLAAEQIGDVYFNHGHANGFDGVGQNNRCVRVGAGVEDDAVEILVPGDGLGQLAHLIGLEIVQLHFGMTLLQILEIVIETERAVDVDLART